MNAPTQIGLSFAVAAALALSGCDATPARPGCVVGADCASGICEPDGFCAPPQAEDGGSRADGGDGTDGGRRDAGARDAATGFCLPNEDGRIERNEAPFGPDLAARYVTAVGVAVNTAGTDLGGGRRSWDFSGALPGDRDLDLQTEGLDGRWFSDLYPGADYVARLSPENDLLGVFRLTASALELLGVVSPNDGIGRTQLTYTPAVRVLAFPLEAGSRWTSDARVTGLAMGLAVNYGETYQSEVDASGEVRTPYAPFEALRVRVTLTRDLTLTRTVVRQFLFVAECFGTVASISSEDDETEIEFDRASEIRRLGF